MENKKVDSTFAIFEILEKTNTNWSVTKEPLFSSDGKQTNVYGIFRSDNNAHIGTVKDRYTCYQNHQTVGLLHEATQAIGLNITNGGTLGDGSKVYYQMGLEDVFIGKSNVKRNITALNSHDGSMSIAFGSTNTVVVCQNTFHRAYKDLDKVKHTVNAQEKLSVMVENLKNAIDADNRLIHKFKVMCDHELKDELIHKVTKKIFNVDLDSKLSTISTKKKNQIEKFSNNLMTEIQLEGKTLWGLFNAVTRYTNYEMHSKNSDAQIESVFLGSGNIISNLAFNEIISYIEENTIELIPVR